MPRPHLGLFVEGNDDERFFKRVLHSKFKKKYQTEVHIIRYQEIKKGAIEGYIKSFDYNCFFFRDNDHGDCKKFCEKLLKDYDKLSKEKIIVIIEEIESWYLAGINKEVAKQYKIKLDTTTDNLTKEHFKDIIKKSLFGYDITDAMSEILIKFNFEQAKKRNSSFNSFCESHL